MNIENLLHILRARRWTLLLTTIVVVALAVVAVALVPRKYTALASVVVSPRGDDPLRAANAGQVSNSSTIATQLDIIKRPRVALRVVKDQNLTADPAWRSAWTDATGGRGDFAAWIGSSLASGLAASLGGDSNVIDIKYTSGDAAKAAHYANAFTNAYLETALELRTTPARQYTTFFDDRLAELRKQLETSQRKLSDFEKANQLVDASGKADIESARLGELSSQLAAAQSSRADSSSRQFGAASNLSASPEVMQNPVVQQLKGQLAAQEVRVKNLAGNLGPNHPEYQRAQAELAELRARVNAESSQVNASLATASRVSAERISELQTALDQQRQRVLAAGQLRDQAQLYQRDVDNAQRAYDLVTQHQAQASLESQVQQSDVTLLDQAELPLVHSWPNVPLVLLLAIMTGVLLGALIALFREYLDPMVRSSRDLLVLTDLPILAVIPASRRLSGRKLLLGARSPLRRALPAH